MEVMSENLEVMSGNGSHELQENLTHNFWGNEVFFGKFLFIVELQMMVQILQNLNMN